MRVYLGSDHAGFELKTHLLSHLLSGGYDAVDVGPTAYDAADDYPPYCIATAQAVIGDDGSLGIVIGGSGNGEQLAANRVKGIRAALIYSVEIAGLARQHNDAQVGAVGARFHSIEDATAIVDAFLSTPFSEDARHQRRIDLMSQFEQTGQNEIPSD